MLSPNGVGSCGAELIQEEEHRTAEYLLRIFRASLPLMPKTAVKFGIELQNTLKPMIIKPSGTGGLAVS
jgi:cohesin loading factor subunit SCC2